MVIKLDNAIKFGKQRGGFGIDILYPGIILPGYDDSGIAGIGRIDQAKVAAGTLIPMHPHIDDEILTYLRTGKVKHLDSQGNTVEISNIKLMMMNAGASFYHEELVLQTGGTLEGLQIFIRPETEGLAPQVQFYELQETYSINQWRELAGRGKNYPLAIRSNTCILDCRLEKGSSLILPKVDLSTPLFLFYVFKGSIKTNNDIVKTGESLLIEKENPTFEATETSDVVLFCTDRNSEFYDGGMYSGRTEINTTANNH